MARTSAEILDYYDEEVVKMISEKYGYDQMEALRQFLVSETYHMCEDAELEMWQFGPLAIFEMWECEKITGDHRKSTYIREV